MADFLHGRGCAQANFSQFLRRENAEMAVTWTPETGPG